MDECWLCGGADPDFRDVFDMWAHTECVNALDEAWARVVANTS